jgi:hypothetical protein
MFIEMLAKLGAHQCEHDHRPLGTCALQDCAQSASIAHTPFELQPNVVIGELKQGGSRYSFGGFARRVADDEDYLRIHRGMAQPRRPSLRPCMRLTRRRFFALRFALRRALLLRLRGRSLLAMFKYMNSPEAGV